MDFNLDSLTALIKHPKYPEIFVKIKQLDEIEKMEHFGELQKFIKVVPLYDNDGKLIVQEGKIATAELQQVPLTTVVDFLRKIILGWGGFTNKGVAIPYNPEDKNTWKILFSKKLDFEEINPNYDANDEQKSKNEKTITTPFWSHIQQKSLEETTFDSDPSGNS